LISLKKYLFNSYYVLNRNRQPWIDYARGISIILVCYRHSFEGVNESGLINDNYPVLKYLNIFLFTFRMPLFFIISGIFLSVSLMRKGLTEYISDRFKTIYYPLLIWGALQISLQLLFADFVNVKREWIDYFYLIVQPRKIEQFWYLNTLFLVGVIYSIINVKLHLNRIQHFLLSIIFYAMGSYLHAQNSRIGAYMLTDVLHFYIFFAIGDCLSTILLNKENNKYFTNFKIFIPVLLLFIVTHYYSTKINLKYEYLKVMYVENYQPIFFLLVSLTGCLFITIVSMYFSKYNIFKFLRIIGYHSLYIYVMHLFVTAAVRIYCLHFLHVQNVTILILISTILGIIIPMIFYNILSKSGFWWLFSLKKPKELLAYKKTD